MLYFVVNFPYNSPLHNYRSSIVHMTNIVIILTSNYYRSMKMNTEISIKSRLHGLAILELLMIGVSVGISFIAVFYELYQLYKTCKK